MGLILKQIFSLLKLLNSDTGHNQISAGVAAGFILGMTPTFSLQTLLVYLLLFVFRVQVGAVFLTAFFFSFMAYLLDPVFHSVGYSILKADGLQGFFTLLYNMPIIPFTRFNNTIVMGSGVVAFVLSPVVFIIARALIIRYRVSIVEKFKESKFWKAVKATGFYKWYLKYEDLYG